MAPDPGAAPVFDREPLPPSWHGSEPGLMFLLFEKNVRLWEFETEVDEKKRGVLGALLDLRGCCR